MVTEELLSMVPENVLEKDVPFAAFPETWIEYTLDRRSSTVSEDPAFTSERSSFDEESLLQMK